MTNKEEKIEINYAYDIPTDNDYSFDEFFNSIEKNELQGINSMRPEETKIWNQNNTPACTCYSLTHIYNGCNIIEDRNLGEKREQQDPLVFWNRFCAARNEYDSGSSIQTMALYFKRNGQIQGYLTIDKDDKDKVKKMKMSLDKGYFLSTGSAFGDWSNIKKTGVYSERADRKFTGHARCIVDYSDGYFRAINSYGDKRGIHNGMFKIPFDMVDKIYSCLVIIDKDDSRNFTDLKIKKKVLELLTMAQELYNNAKPEQKKYFEQIMLSKNLKQLYNI